LFCATQTRNIYADLVRFLTFNTDDGVFIHVDGKSNKDEFVSKLKKLPKVKILDHSRNVYWGGYSTILATLDLLEAAYNEDKWDRYVLLQGLDYPIKPNKYIHDFFESSNEIEFIRACNISKSNDKYHLNKIGNFHFYDKINFAKRVLNKLANISPVYFKRTRVSEAGREFDVFWGAAQWALTRECVEYILEFARSHTEFNHYFKTTANADELYFHTIVYNSRFSKRTLFGAEQPKRKLANWRNLHYFEYEGEIKVFDESDFQMLAGLDELFIRKVTTARSKKLLDMIDKNILGL